MHMDEPARAGSLMQRVNVLGHGQYVSAMLRFELGQRDMGSIGSRLFVPAAAEIVEVLDADGILRKGFRCRYVLDLEIRPETAGAPECAETALGR
jgi:hypothetical protein